MEDKVCPECESSEFIYNDITGESICKKCGLINADSNIADEHYEGYRSKLNVGKSTIGNIPEKNKQNMSAEELKQCPDVKPESRSSGESIIYEEDFIIDESERIMDRLNLNKTYFRNDVISIIRKCFIKNCFNGVNARLTLLAIINKVRLIYYRDFQKQLLKNSDSRKYMDFIKSSHDFIKSFSNVEKKQNITKTEQQRLVDEWLQNLENMKSLKNFELKGYNDQIGFQKIIVNNIEGNFNYSWKKIESRINFLIKKGIFDNDIGLITWHESNNFSKFDSKYKDILERSFEFYKEALGIKCILKNSSEIKKINEILPYYALAVSLVSRKSKNTGMTHATLFYLLKEHEEYSILEFNMPQNNVPPFWGIGNAQFKKNLSILRDIVFLKNSHMDFLTKINAL